MRAGKLLLAGVQRLNAALRGDACANVEDGSLTVRATAIAILVPKIFRETDLMTAFWV